MQLKPVLLLCLLAFFSLTAATTVTGQCLADSEYKVSFESNTGSIAIRFEKNTTGVVIELVDLQNGKQAVMRTKKLTVVTQAKNYVLFDKLQASVYALTITADDCDNPKFGAKVIEVGPKEGDE